MLEPTKETRAVLPTFASSYQASGEYYSGRFALNPHNTDVQELIDKKPSNALAFAADEHASHVVSGIARFRKVRKRPVPARMIGIMTRRTSFAMIALPATRTVQHDFVRSG